MEIIREIWEGGSQQTKWELQQHRISIESFAYLCMEAWEKEQLEVLRSMGVLDGK